MAIEGQPRVIIYGEVAERFSASAASASPVVETAAVGVKAGTAFTPNATGTATAVGVKASLSIALVASTPQTIDLKAMAALSGTKAFAIVHAIVVQDQGDPTAAGTVTISNTGVNAWTNGPFNATGVVIAKGGEWAQRNAQAAGWAVTTTNKIVTLTPSANNTTLNILILGE